MKKVDDMCSKKLLFFMARKCEVSGKRTRFGNNVSHSNRKTKRPFKANVHTKRVYLEDEKRWVTMNISTRVLRTMQKNGVKSVLSNIK